MSDQVDLATFAELLGHAARGGEHFKEVLARRFPREDDQACFTNTARKVVALVERLNKLLKEKVDHAERK